MTDRWDRLAERRILAARAKGQLQGLAGEGKPLPHHPEATFTDPGEAVGYRIMAEHGVLPEELRLKAEAEAARKVWQAAVSPEEKRAAMKRLADLELRHAIAREARQRFMQR